MTLLRLLTKITIETSTKGRYQRFYTLKSDFRLPKKFILLASIKAL